MIALSLLAIDEQVDRLSLGVVVALGELALDGTVRPVRGILPMVLGARNAGFTRLLVPADNANEAALVEGLETYAIRSLTDAVAMLRGFGDEFRLRAARPSYRARTRRARRLADVRGQSTAKRALEIAAARGHNVLLVGPPGAARRCWRGDCRPFFLR